tara:strand:+ start:237 stop:605 length:369 start_codon:yes stop_codon:yes gene_type:complete
MENKHVQPKPPSLFQMMRSFTKELTKYIAEGAPNVSPEDYADRLDMCEVCPHLIRNNMRCNLCGCLIEHKAKWQTTKCPDNPERWKPQNICNDQKQENNNPKISNQIQPPITKSGEDSEPSI